MDFGNQPERGESIVPALLEAETKRLVDELGAAMLARLSLGGSPWVVVTHGKFPRDGGFVYDLSLACDAAPDFARMLRRCFPRARTGQFRASLGPFADLNLENVDDERLRGALVMVPQVKLPLTPQG